MVVTIPDFKAVCIPEAVAYTDSAVTTANA